MFCCVTGHFGWLLGYFTSLCILFIAVLQHTNKKEYAENPEFAKIYRLLACLPFLPIDSIEDAMFVIYERTRQGGDYASMIPIVESFEKTYLGSMDINGRSGALFAIEDWNFYDEIVGREIPRTNNSVEGFHRGFTDRFTGAHPPMMKFVNALKQQQRATDFTVNRMDYDINDLNKRNKLCVLDTARHS